MKTWTTKDGKVIPIKDLTDDHLLNIIKHLENLATKRAAYATVESQGTICSASDLMPDIPMEWMLPPIYETLVFETKLRRL